MKNQVFLILITIFVLFGCNKKDEPEIIEEIVAKVNNDFLTEKELKANFTESEWDTLSSFSKRDFVRKWIDLTLLAQNADEAGLSDNPYIKSRIKSAELKIKANSYLSSQIAKLEATEKEMFDYFRVHKKKYQKQETEYKMQQIVVTKKDDLDLLKAELNKGEKFSEVAKKYSKHKSGSGGGYIGFVSKEDIDPQIWNKLIKLKKYYFDTIKLGNEYFVFRYYDTRTITTDKTFEEVKDEIKDSLIKNKRNDIYNNTLEKIKSKAKIEISI